MCLYSPVSLMTLVMIQGLFWLDPEIRSICISNPSLVPSILKAVRGSHRQSIGNFPLGLVPYILILGPRNGSSHG